MTSELCLCLHDSNQRRKPSREYIFVHFYGFTQSHEEGKLEQKNGTNGLKYLRYKNTLVSLFTFHKQQQQEEQQNTHFYDFSYTINKTTYFWARFLFISHYSFKF